MSLKIPSYNHLAGSYNVKYAEANETILKTPGWKRSRHKYWALDIGPVRGTVRVNGETHSRNRNSVGLYAPGVRYEESIEVGALVSWHWLLIEELASPSLLRQLTGEKGFSFFHDPTQSIRKQIRQLVEASYISTRARGFFLTARLHDILGIMFTLEGRTDSELNSRKQARNPWVHPWRKTAWDLLESASSGSVKSLDLARALNVSLSTLTHRYRDYCGESLRCTVNSWRLEKACTLLTETNLSIKEIAARTGWAHQSYLSNFVKAQKGLTPSEYRQLSRRS